MYFPSATRLRKSTTASSTWQSSTKAVAARASTSVACVQAVLMSNQRKVFRYSMGTTAGGFYNGENINFNGEVNFRYQPYGSVSVRFDYNELKLPDNFGREKLFVVSPRFDLTLTSKIFLTTFVQYNTLLDNVNLNARFQWRYKPASDFFVVYTENYLPETFGSKNRALVFKFTYWLNI